VALQKLLEAVEAFDGSVHRRGNTQDRAHAPAFWGDTAGEWGFSIQFEALSLQHLDPVPLLVEALCEYLPATGPLHLETHHVLGLVLRELYNNALDHGIMGLDSKLKRGKGGLERYYLARQAKIGALCAGSVHFDFQYDAGQGRLTIDVADSGPGFDVEALLLRWQWPQGVSGRGLILVKSLSEVVTFSDQGSHIHVELGGFKS
jgi:hypothetical protein